jgi:hypothetical protein
LLRRLRFEERLLLGQIEHQERRIAGLDDGDPDSPAEIIAWAGDRLILIRGWIDRLPSPPET